MKLRRSWLLAGGVVFVLALVVALSLRPTKPMQAGAAEVLGKGSAAAPEKAGQSIDELLAAGQRAQALTAAEVRSRKFEVCGQRVLDRDADPAEIEVLRKQIAARVPDVLTQAGIRLAARSAPSERAAGLWAQWVAEGDRWASELESTRKGNVLVINLPPAPVSVTKPLGALVRFAAESKDPAALRMALGACGLLNPAPPVCQSVSWAQLAEVEPDNAANWLSVAAGLRANSPEQDAALQRALAAPQLRVGMMQAAGVLASHLEGLSDPPTAQLALLTATSASISEGLGRPAVWSAISRCGQPKGEINDTQRRECSALGRRMAHSDDLLMAMQGLGMEARYTASAAERDALNAQAQVLQQAALRSTDAEYQAGFLSCAAIAATRQRMQRVAQIGEAGVAREQLAREAQAAKSGVPVR
jgi:hypothetical protein